MNFTLLLQLDFCEQNFTSRCIFYSPVLPFSQMERFAKTKHTDLTRFFRASLSSEPKRGTVADNITKINISDFRIGMIAIILNEDHEDDWGKAKMTAYLQKTCDTPFIMELVEAPDGDERDLAKGFINTDEIKSIWVLNQSIISEIVSQATTDETRKALKCTPIAPSISLQMMSSNSSMARASTSSENMSGSSGSSNSAMLGHNQNDRKLFPCLRVSNMNEELVQSIRGNTDDIQKDTATINLLHDRIPTELRHLPIASIAGIEVIRDFKAFNETSSYNSTTRKFSGVGLNMCLPWADAAKSKLTEITSHIQLAEAVQILQQVLESIWQPQSHSIFGPWFSDLREEFVSTTFTGFRSLPIKLQLLTLHKWVANMISSFTLMSLCHLSMEGFNETVRKSLKINVLELHSEIQAAASIITSQQSISLAGLSDAAIGYALARGLSVEIKATGTTSANVDGARTPHGVGKRQGRKAKLPATATIDSPELKKLRAQVVVLEQTIKKAAFAQKVTVGTTAPPGNNASLPKNGVCISHIAFLLGINPLDCKIGYPACGRPHIDMEPITPVFKATLRGYVSGFKPGQFKNDLEARIAALV